MMPGGDSLVPTPPGGEVSRLVDFLREEVARRHLPVVVYGDEARLAGRQVKVPAYVEGVFDAYDKATMLQEVEDAWNEKEPAPALLAVLLPATQKRRAVSGGTTNGIES